jgi:hypothetical protein
MHWVTTTRRLPNFISKGKMTMAKPKNRNDDLSTIAQLIRHLLAIELWRGGLSQAEIGKRLGVATGSVSKMLKGVSRAISSGTGNAG